MPRVKRFGKLEFPPSLGLAMATESIEKIEHALGGKTGSRKAIGEALGQPESSGAFQTKLAALKKFGLVQGYDENYSVTEIGKKLAFPQAESNDYSDAVLGMLKSIDIFRTIYERFGNSIPSETQFSAALIDLAGAERVEVHSNAAKLRNSYIELLSKVNGEEKSSENEAKPESTENYRQAAPKRDTRMTNPLQIVEGIVLTPSEIMIRLPYSVANLEKAIKRLNFELDMKREEDDSKPNATAE